MYFVYVKGQATPTVEQGWLTYECTMYVHVLEVGRCRYFASVSVFGFLVGFYKSRFGIRYRFLKISDIGSVFRLSNPFP